MPYSARLILLRGEPEPRRRVFTWRNWLRRPPRLAVKDDCPLSLRRPRYYAYASLGSTVGTLLRFDVVNRSAKTIHSYTWRHCSHIPQGNGAFGVQPEAPFVAGQSRKDSCALGWHCPITLTVDFVQFADGSTWFSSTSEATVRPAGVQAGAAAAAGHLSKLLAKDGPEVLLSVLPRIHAEVPAPALAAEDSGAFGFYAGVTNIAIRVADLASRGEILGIADLLRGHCDAK
jgi:hypothetical protein